jgi:predicted ATPase
MHLDSLEVSNFKAIKFASLSALPSAVVIAGPNGCGKSCLLDAIRIWKSAYGGYNVNEFDQAFSEFGVNIGHLDADLPRLFRDPAQPIVIRASVTLSEQERQFLRKNADGLLARTRRRQQTQNVGRGIGRRPFTAETENAERARGADAAHRRLVDRFVAQLEDAVFEGTFTITPSLQLTKTPSALLELIYSIYLPEDIGVFEYHSAHRTYQRHEEISNVDLRLEVAAEQQSQHALFNWAQKYQNVKTQLVGSYVRELIANAADANIKGRESLVESLGELFRLFFPDKQFLGVQPNRDGRVTLNVRTASGKEHDITELSSGEKEVLYGYLRMRNLAPRNSVLLLDEPELHLNPRLIGGLPQFYRTHLGKNLENQIWLVTHSDVLLEKALDVPDYAVYHMLPADSAATDNQLVRVTNESLERVIIDLVGEKASYTRKGTLVIFEGGGDSDFDRTLTCELFPELRSKANPISGTNRARVVGLRRLLEAATAAGEWRPKVFSITDRDSVQDPTAFPDRELSWDVYHIENYLLEPSFVLSALKEALREKCEFQTREEVDAALRGSAMAALEPLVTGQLVQWARQELYACLSIGCDPSGKGLADALSRSAVASVRKAETIIGEKLSPAELCEQYELRMNKGRTELQSDGWRSNIPGRSILAQFVATHGAGLSYTTLRNLVIARMRADGYRPLGMSKVVSEILNA